MTLAIIFHFLCVQHVSDINIIHHQELATILLNYHITTPKLQHTSNQEQYDQRGNSTE